jgi:hypothetical protein
LESRRTRITSCSTLWHSSLRPVCSRLSPGSFRTPLGLPRAGRRFDSVPGTERFASLADCSAHSASRRAARGLLRNQHFESLAPLPDCSVPGTRCLPSCLNSSLQDFSRFESLLPDALHPPLRADRSARNVLAFRAGLRIAPYAHTLRPYGLHGLLRACRFSSAPAQIALCSTLGVWCDSRISPCPASTPRVVCGCLRFQRLELCTESVALRSRYLSLRPALGLLLVRHLAFQFRLRIAPHSSLSALLLVADYSATNNLFSAPDLLAFLT